MGVIRSLKVPKLQQAHPRTMTRSLKLFALFSLLSGNIASLVGASPGNLAYKHVLKEVFVPSKQWVRLHPAPPDYMLALRINLVQPQFDTLVNQLYAVSEPDSPHYGQHLSKEQIQALTAPSSDGLVAVKDWLLSHGFNLNDMEWSPSNDWMRFGSSVQKAEEMLNTTYHTWENTVTGGRVVRTTTWSVPEHLVVHIDLVHPTTMFPSLTPEAVTYRILDEEPVAQPAVSSIPSDSPQAVDPSCNATITPTCLLQLYNATQYKVQAADKGNQIAIASYLEEFANIADLQQFYTALRPDAVNSSFKVVSINGGENNQTLSEAGGEADLDTQYAFGLTFPTPATVFTTGGRPPFLPDQGTPTDTNEPYLDWVDFLLAQDNIPQSISTSYGDDEQTVPLSFARVVCSKFAALGARGVTLSFSSGDGGVGDNDPDPTTAECLTNDGKNQTKFIPGFPASCPFVTAVGATQSVPEVAVTRFGSGGGFSNYFPRPVYQDAAVGPFLKALGDTNKGFFNSGGRAIPDVSAQGDRFEVFVGGRRALIGGTSASSPTFAGIVALLNDARIAAGKRPLGFLNPLLYSKATHAFNDITIGTNPGCGTEGFSCGPGWDAVTGFGTPNFGLLKEIVLKER